MADSLSGWPGPLRYTSQMGTDRPYERELLFDESKEALVSDLGEYLKDWEIRGIQLGEFSLTALVIAPTLEEVERATSDVMKAVGKRDGAMNEERYNGLNVFRFINAADVSTPVRWSMVPVDAFKPEDTAQSANPDKNYLFDDFIARIHSAPVQWRLILTVGQPGDPTDDATIPWPEDREHVDAGTLTLDEVESEAPGNCRDINFDPLVLPVGIAPSDDPLLSARSAVYSQSFTRRAGEKKELSAITPSDVQK